MDMDVRESVVMVSINPRKNPNSYVSCQYAMEWPPLTSLQEAKFIMKATYVPHNCK
jgi:hypothetical protein